MKGLFAAIAATAIASAASGAIYTFQSNNPGLDIPGANTDAGTASNITSTYDSATSMFTWNVTFSDGQAKGTNGFWLVVGPGPNPKGIDHEYAIMYFDASSLANPNVSIFRYNGLNADTSYTNPGDLLATTKTGGQTTIQNVTAGPATGPRTFSFKVNAATINSAFGSPTYPDWKGIQFGTGNPGSEIGIWFHPVDGLQTTYDANNKLKTFTYATQGWYDGEYNHAPAPASAALLGLGGLVAARRRR